MGTLLPYTCSSADVLMSVTPDTANISTMRHGTQGNYIWDAVHNIIRFVTLVPSACIVLHTFEIHAPEPLEEVL